MSGLKVSACGPVGAGDGAFEAVLEPCVLGASPPERVLVAPWGEVRSANGDFVMDEEAVQAVVGAFETHATDLPIDYEHQSLGGAYASPSGQAPAAGWIRGLHVVRPSEETAFCAVAGLWADVFWTESGRERVTSREYRYLSPVVLVRKSDRRVVALHSAALTNKPAISGMRPLVNAAERTGGPSTEVTCTGSAAAGGEREAEAAGLGNAPAATKAGDCDTDAGVLGELRAGLGLGARADVQAVLVAASERLVQLTREQAQQAAAQRVAEAARSGKVTEGLRSWALELAMRDPACFEAWVAAAPVIVSTGRTAAPGADALGCDRAAVVASARMAFRSEPALASVTSEEAWIADALREAGMESENVRK